MLEFFAYKKFKKHKEEKKNSEDGREHKHDETTSKESHHAPKSDAAASTAAGSSSAAAATAAGTGAVVTGKPTNKLTFGTEGEQEHVVLEESDQAFIERILAQADEEAPPLPPRVKTPDISWDSNSESGVPVGAAEAEKDGKGKDKGKEKDEKKKNRFSFLQINLKKHNKPDSSSQNLKPVAPITEQEVDKETADLTSVLSRLNLAAGANNKAISLSSETSELVSKFTVAFKDLMNGVPTAYDDMMSLIEDHDGVLSRNYEKLPSSLKKLITTLPTKLTSTLAPELLAVAAEAQGLEASSGPAGKEELKDAAKKFLTPASLAQLVKKPGAILTMLKGIVNALKARWPAFMGTNVVWAVAISILMFVLWYCHKRGRETRLEREKSDASGIAKVNDEDRIEELADDPALPAPVPKSASTPAVSTEEPAGPSVTVTEPQK